MKRRTFIVSLGSAAAWPLVAGGEQSTVAVVGFLNSGSLVSVADQIEGYLKSCDA